MSRSIDEVERSLAAHRGELAQAIKDMRRGLDQGSEQLGEAKEFLETGARARAKEELAKLRARAEEEVAKLRERVAGDVDGHGDQLALGALGAGFVAGGGVRGAARLPLKFVGISSSRSEVVVKRDRHSRQVGRALAAVASADRQVRRPTGVALMLVRRLALVAPVGAGLAFLMAEDDQIPEQLVEPREKLLELIFSG